MIINNLVKKCFSRKYNYSKKCENCFTFSDSEYKINLVDNKIFYFCSNNCKEKWLLNKYNLFI